MVGTSPEMPTFARKVSIDYSGAKTPNASLKGLRIYLAEGDMSPVEVPPPPSPRKYWTRRGIVEWLIERLAEDVPTLVGIDHGFSFPLRYFEVHRLKPDWPAFLDDFQRHWPTDENIYVDFVCDGVVGNGAARTGSSRWRRLTEERSGSAKSGFSLRRAGIGGEVHPRWNSLAALHSAASRRTRTFLAIRRLGHSGRPFSYCRGLSQTMEPPLCTRGPHR
jgi:hypothetical protein